MSRPRLRGHCGSKNALTVQYQAHLSLNLASLLNMFSPLLHDPQCTHFDVDKLEYVRPSMRCVCIVSCSLSLKICPILCFQSLRLIPSGPRPLPTTVDLIVMPV